MKETKLIGHACDIRFGIYAQPTEKGQAAYLQVRQFNEDGQLVVKSDEFINIDEKSQSNLLTKGDILFVGKGSRLFAWCYDEEIGPAVASSIFFVLRPRTGDFYPEYIATVLNAPQSKADFQKSGGGSNIFSIRKPELAAFELPLLPMAKQKSLAAVAATHLQWISATKVLISQKQTLYNAIISKSLK